MYDKSPLIEGFLISGKKIDSDFFGSSCVGIDPIVMVEQEEGRVGADCGEVGIELLRGNVRFLGVLSGRGSPHDDGIDFVALFSDGGRNEIRL